MKKTLGLLLFAIIGISAFAQKTESQLTTQINVIRNETSVGGNTKGRIADMFEAINYSKQGVIAFKATSGTNTYTATINSNITSYITDDLFFIRITEASTGTSTLNLVTSSMPSGIGAKKIFKTALVQAGSGDLLDDTGYIMMYNSALDSGSGGFLIVGGTGGGGGSTLQQKDVSGTTYTVTDADDNYLIHLTNALGCTVTMPNTVSNNTSVSFRREDGSGVTTFVDDGTSTLSALGTTLDSVKYVCTWIKNGATEFDGFGQLGTVSGGTWGSITGTLSDQTDLQSALNAKQDDLVSGTNIKTVNGNSLVGSGNVAVGDALVANPLSQFASTTSAQVASTVSDETGSTSGGLLVFNNGPVLIAPNLGTPVALVGTNITGTASGLTSGVATSLQTARTIGTITGDATSAGSSFDGTANNTNSLTLANTTVSAGSYTIGNFTVDSKGRLTAASSAGTTGSGNVVLASGATLINPIVGTQSANDNSNTAASTAYADAKVAEAITNGVTGVAPSEDQVFDALALKLSTALAQGSFIVGNSSNVATAYRLGYVTPEMYGAVRDGSTDDATAITNAFGSGLPVYFGPGNYRIASGIAVPAGATAYGFGEATIISTTQTTINMFTLNGRASLTGIKFLGSDQSGQIGIVVSDVISTSTEVGNVLENCRFVDLRYGIQGATVYSANFEGAIQATNCQFISNSIGVWLQAGAEYNKFTNCSSVGNTTGVRWDAGNNIWTGGQITNNTTGVQFNTGSNAGKFIFNGTHINHNTTAVLSNGITITGEFIGCNFISASKLDITTSYIRFIGCYFNDTSQQAWSFTNSTSIVDIISCRFGMTSANQPTVTQSGTAVNFLNNYFESGVVPTYAQGTTHGAITQTPFAATGTYTNWTQNGSLTASSGTSQSYIGFNMTPTYNTTSTFTGTAAGFRYAATRTSVTGLSEYPIITNGGLHGIGTLTPTETLHVVGRGTTSSTYNALFQNSTPSNVFAIRDDGATQYGSAGSRPSIYASAGTSTVSNSGASLTINASNANANSVFINNGLTQFANILSLGGSFTNSSGTQSVSFLKIVPTINNTSTYSGEVNVIDYNPTETSLTGTTNSFIRNRSTTANSAFAMTALPTAKIHIGAGASGINTAPLKLTSGTLNTTAEAGAVEYNDQYYATKASGLRFALGGVIADFTSDVNNSGTGETDLYTYTTPASTLANTGEKVTFDYNIILNDVTATAQVKVLFAGTMIGDTGALTVSATGAVVVRGYIIRTGSSTARASVNISSPTASTAVYTKETDLTGLTFTNTNIIKVTGTAGGAGGGSDDITGKLGTIMWMGSANN